MIELIQSEVVRDYELTYLLPTTLTSSETAQAQEKITKLITKLGGSITTTEDWGKKELAYAIRYASKDQDEALYTHLIFSLPAQAAQGLERDLQLNPKVMRHLLILAEPAVVSTEVTEEDSRAQTLRNM